MDTLSEAANGPLVSISQAVLCTSARSISHCVCSSTSGNWIAWVAAGAGEDQVMRGGVHPGVPRLLAIEDPVVAGTARRGLHERGVRAVRGLGDAEREAPPARRQVLGPLGPLLRAAVVQHEQ